jgi:hypothetical protein
VTFIEDFFPLHRHLSYYIIEPDPLFIFHGSFLSKIGFFQNGFIFASHSIYDLSSSSDWLQWFQLIETAAVNTDIWDYVNSNVKKDIIPTCTEPEEPTYRTVNRAATTFRDFEPLEREELRDLFRSSFKRKYTVYREQKIASFKFGQTYSGNR